MYVATIHIDKIHPSSGVKYTDSQDAIFDTHTEARKWARAMVKLSQHGGRYEVKHQREQVIYQRSQQPVRKPEPARWVK